MKVSGWGRFPVIEAKEVSIDDPALWDERFATSGQYRSYGDAALGDTILPMSQQQLIESFDETTGLLTCQAGVRFEDIIETFLPRGWFLKVTPGTSKLTVGGAVASDVHGKNHHIDGCFSNCIDSLSVLWPNGEIVVCSKSQNAELFQATCGGMGLTGIIVKVSFFLKRVKSRFISQCAVKTKNLDETFEVFEHYKNEKYSVAWIDCLAKDKRLGRSILMVGDFKNDYQLSAIPSKTLSVPFAFPNWTLNSFTVKAFNELYYHKQRQPISYSTVSVESFFYPLDSINQWNLIYGSRGFTQFQFILPKENSFEGMRSILQKISDKGFGSFLAVLKLYGPQNHNWLSFPIEGYSLALDFKMTSELAAFISQLTDYVISLGGRIYLAKDALMTKEQFHKSYSNLDKFKAFRKEHKLDQFFTSALAQRLGF